MEFNTRVSMSCELGIVRGSILVSLVYQEPKISCEAFSRSGLLGHCVKKTLCCTSSYRHLGWLMSQAWPRELEMTSFIFCLLSLTAGSMLVLLILSISFSGTSMANGVFCLMYSATFNGSLSAYDAEMRRSNFSVVGPTVFEMGSVGVHHR
jgi:hypothetical protein